MLVAIERRAHIRFLVKNHYQYFMLLTIIIKATFIGTSVQGTGQNILRRLFYLITKTYFEANTVNIPIVWIRKLSIT